MFTLSNNKIILCCAGVATIAVIFQWDFWSNGLSALGVNVTVVGSLLWLLLRGSKETPPTRKDVIWLAPFWMLLLSYSSQSHAQNENRFITAVSDEVEMVLAYPKNAFSLSEPTLFELHGDYSEFAAGAIAHDLLNVLEQNKQLYFSLDFDQWIDANELLFKLDDHISENSEYGNALIKSYLNSLWLTSGYNWLSGDVVLKQRAQNLDIDAFIQHWKRIQFRIIDMVAVVLINSKDMYKWVNFSKSDLVTRSLSANETSLEGIETDLHTKLVRGYREISVLDVVRNRKLFGDPEHFSRLIQDEKYRNSHIRTFVGNGMVERIEEIQQKTDLSIDSLGHVGTHLDIPNSLLILNTFGMTWSKDHIYKAFRNLMIRARFLKKYGFDFVDWKNIEYVEYLSFCELGAWCSREHIDFTLKFKRLPNDVILTGRLEQNYLGLIHVMEQYKSSMVRWSKRRSRHSAR